MNYLLRLTPEEHKVLKKLAAEKGVSMKDLILTLIKKESEE